MQNRNHFNLIAKRIDDVFNIAKVEKPKDLIDIVAKVKALDSETISETDGSKNDKKVAVAVKAEYQIHLVLLAQIIKLQNQLETERSQIQTKQLDKIIQLYNAILQNYGLGDRGKRVEFMQKYNNTSETIAAEEKLQAASKVAPGAKELLEKIKVLRHYGEGLKSNKVPKKGKAVCDLADNLENRVTAISNDSNANEQTLEDFKKNFKEELESKAKEMSHYRVNLATIFKNIGIALLSFGVGAVALGVKAAISAYKHHRPLPFFSKPKTTSEGLVEEIKGSFNKIGMGNKG